VSFYCVADEDTVRGFRLAGVEGEAVATAEEASAALQRAAARSGCGVILLTERVAAGIREQVEAFRRERERPLLVEIPGPEGALPGRKRLWRFVEEAVGISLD